jgi:F0F1-type ATP synthase assembly protein I
VWSAVAIVLGMLPSLLTQNFESAPWMLLAVGVIGIVAKVWEVYKPSGTPDTNPLNFESASVSASASKTKRFLVG